MGMPFKLNTTSNNFSQRGETDEYPQPSKCASITDSKAASIVVEGFIAMKT
jgi:hypothetical protein